MQNATHLSWATGGGLVPKAIMDDFKKAGASVKIEF
jgi:D-serine dehydratase